MDARWISAAAASLALASLATWAPSASATFHLISVREVYPGSAASATAEEAEYVELQMYSSDQNLVGEHILATYSASGVATKNVLAADVPNGATQSTILLATPEAEAQFGSTADGALSPSGQLDPAGGAVCWETFDCVSWGSFSGQASLPSPAGPPATPAGIPDGMALRRAIAPGCATLLESGDDSDGSAVDFSAVFPSPRPNSVTPSEHACSSQTGGGGAQAGGGGAGTGSMHPQTRIRKHPGHRTPDRTPTFRFSSNVPGSTYLCKLDSGRFKRCGSPFTAHRLSLGPHLFKVKARAPGGATDHTPAGYAFTVVRAAEPIRLGLFRAYAFRETR